MAIVALTDCAAKFSGGAIKNYYVATDYVCKRCEKLNVDTVPSTSPWGHSTVHPFMTIERVNHFENIPKAGSTGATIVTLFVL